MNLTRVVLPILWSALALSVGAAERQTAQRLTLPSGEVVRFWQYVPPDVESPTPLVLFLHGGGESGDEIEVVKKHGPPALIENGQDFPAIILSPQLPDRRGFWDEDLLARFLQAYIARNAIDPTRIYLTGLSRGGYGAWRLAIENPELFAGMVVISGAAPAPYAGWLGDLPIQVFHGDNDQAIPVDESRRMAAAIAKAGGNVSLTVYPDTGHDAWTRTYENPAVWAWLFNQRRLAPTP